MKKYQTEFKLKVVKSFLDGDGGAKLLARQWSVPEEKIRTWVSHFRLHGACCAERTRTVDLGSNLTQLGTDLKAANLQVRCLDSLESENAVVLAVRGYAVN